MLVSVHTLFGCRSRPAVKSVISGSRTSDRCEYELPDFIGRSGLVSMNATAPQRFRNYIDLSVDSETEDAFSSHVTQSGWCDVGAGRLRGPVRGVISGPLAGISGCGSELRARTGWHWCGRRIRLWEARKGPQPRSVTARTQAAAEFLRQADQCPDTLLEGRFHIPLPEALQ
jgi:hypothetical protein